MLDTAKVDLPGLDCGLCGVRSCAEFAVRLETHPGLIERCIHLSDHRLASSHAPLASLQENMGCGGCVGKEQHKSSAGPKSSHSWHDTLGREFDFCLPSRIYGRVSA